MFLSTNRKQAVKNYRLLICLICLCVTTIAQNSGKRYTFKEIGWSFVLPADFIPAKITPATGPDDGTNSRRLMVAMKEDNLIMVSIGPIQQKKKYDEDNRTVFIKNYQECAKAPNVTVDSSTSFENLGNVQFIRKQIAVKSNGKIQYKMIALTGAQKEYAIAIEIRYSDKAAKEELENLLQTSSFVK